MFENNINGNGKVLLNNGKKAEPIMIHSLRNFILEKYSTLSKHRIYTLKNMHKPMEWDGLDDGTRRQKGDCLAHLVATQQVPMICLGKNSSNSLIYQFI